MIVNFLLLFIFPFMVTTPGKVGIAHYLGMFGIIYVVLLIVVDTVIYVKGDD